VVGELKTSTQKSFPVLSLVIVLFSGLISGVVSTTIVFTIYQAPQLAKYQQQLDIMNETLSVQHQQIGIMNESLVKRVQLVLEVVPRYSYSYTQSSYGSYGTYQLTNTTLSLSRTEPTVFHVYVSNVGNSIAHLLYWTVAIWAPHQTQSGPMYDIQNVVVAPDGLYNMTYTFNSSAFSNDNEVVLTFALMSTESIVYETVNATLR
jgi:hypothetical protein